MSQRNAGFELLQEQDCKMAKKQSMSPPYPSLDGVMLVLAKATVDVPSYRLVAVVVVMCGRVLVLTLTECSTSPFDILVFQTSKNHSMLR